MTISKKLNGVLDNAGSMFWWFRVVFSGTGKVRRANERKPVAISPGVTPKPRRDLSIRIQKRAYDLIVASIALVLLAPFFAVAAIAIKLSSPGPVFFRQNRYGKDGALFSMFKFRTMRTDLADASGVLQTVKDDPRITRIGGFLRKTSLDELPQFLNIIMGEMSVVGPRPHVPGMLAAGMLYEDFDPRYMDRLAVRPGLTGLAQVNGYRGETTMAEAARNRLNYDLEYIRQQSLMLDIEITAKTFWNEFFRGSGY